MLSASRPPADPLKKLFAAALPSPCALCGTRSPEPICAPCRDRYLVTPSSRCAQCANQLPHTATNAATLCGSCLSRPPAYDATIVALNYAAPIDQLVLSLKFAGRLALAPVFADALLQALGTKARPDLLTIVPLGRQRLVERGFNQANEIARPLAKRLHVPLMPGLLLRQRETLPQSSLHHDERRRNIRHAFALSAGALQRVHGKHMGVVDDVMTTGETLNEVAITLKRAGAARVTNLVFARAPL